MHLNNDWIVYVRKPAGDSGYGWVWAALGAATPLARGVKRWAPLKVAREPRRPGRNAYQLAYSMVERRIAEGADYRALVQRDPDLAVRLAEVLRAEFLAPNVDVRNT